MFIKITIVFALLTATNVWAQDALIVRQNADSGCFIYDNSVYFTYQGEEVGARYNLLFTNDIASLSELKATITNAKKGNDESEQNLKDFTDLNCQGE